ncbi:MAG: hypothetical protein HY078_09155 [Elusimicrobia bacterium]|nr:hypothetical protein [Elusimicrobiota bacterium]
MPLSPRLGTRLAAAGLAAGLACSVLAAAPADDFAADVEAVRAVFRRLVSMHGTTNAHISLAQVDALLAEALALDREERALAALGDDELARAAARLEAAVERCEALRHRGRPLSPVGGVVGLAEQLQSRLVATGARAAGPGISALEASLKSLSGLADAGRLDDARGQSAAAWEQFKRTSGFVDRLGSPLSETVTGLRGRLNAAAAEVARVRDLIAGGPVYVPPPTSGRTVGDPARRAALVHQQRAQACAVVAQQQMLIEYGLLPRGGDLVQQEEELHREARRKGHYKSGYFLANPNNGGIENGATSREYLGNLLSDRGLVVAKRGPASRAELDRALASGKMLMAEVDAGELWSSPSSHGFLHVIVVTGADLDAAGRPVAVYVNDSGVNAGGRRMSREEFLRAWEPAGRRFVEVL